MNFTLFATIVGWMGAVVFGIATFFSFAAWYHYECTVRGKLSRIREGFVITNYKIGPRLIGFLLSVATLISVYFG